MSVAAVKSHLKEQSEQIKRLYDVYTRSRIKHLTIDGSRVIIHEPNNINKIYIPEKTADTFFRDDSFFRIVMGAVRSGKSSSSCMEVIRRACNMPRCKDGVRRSITAIIRNTYPELKTTTIKTWQNWFRNLGNVKAKFDSPVEFRHIFNDGQGIVDLTVWFISLDKEKDVQKLLSMEVTNAYWNEIRDAPYSIVEILTTRVGQYPPRIELQDHFADYWFGIWGDTNPSDTDHWIYDKFYKNKGKNRILITQPPGVIKNINGIYITNPDAENLKNLPIEYYSKLAQDASEEFIKVYLKGEFGSFYDGKVVYANYSDSLHAFDTLKINENAKIYVGWDFGLTPAALVCAFDGLVLSVIKEFTTERAYFSELIDVVLPWVEREYPSYEQIDIPDPAGDTPSYTDGITGFKMLLERKRKVVKLDGKDYRLEPRIGSVDAFLRKLVQGKPCLQVSKDCNMLRKGFLGKYYYRKVRMSGDERIHFEPEKNHPYSDIHDCLQGVAVYLLGKDEERMRKVSEEDKNISKYANDIMERHLEQQLKRRSNLWR